MKGAYLQRVKSTIERIATIAGVISGVTIIVMMLLTDVDVIFRKCGSGLTGVTELNALMLVVVGFFAFAHCWNREGHIRINLFLERRSPGVKLASKALGTLIGLIFFGAIMWGGIGFAFNAYKEQEVSPILMIPTYPVKILLVVGCSIFVLRLLVSFIMVLNQKFKGISNRK